MQLIDMTNKENIQSDAIRQCIEFACKNDLQAIPMGKHDIDGDDIYAVVNEYCTKASDETVWEAHREYVDLQMVVKGEELIEVTPLSDMNCGEYVTTQDFLPCEGVMKEAVHMQPGIGLLLFPEDAHKPGVAQGGIMPVKKIVFKIHCKRL